MDRRREAKAKEKEEVGKWLTDRNQMLKHAHLSLAGRAALANFQFEGQKTTPDAVRKHFAEKEIIPVIAPLGMGRNGETFNINGDTAAGAIAAALKADRLLLLTDVAGVKNAAGEVMTELKAHHIREMTEDGTIAGGMIPKTETALDAVEGGVRAAVIIDGRAPNACLLELFTEHGAGSMIRP